MADIKQGDVTIDQSQPNFTRLPVEYVSAVNRILTGSDQVIPVVNTKLKTLVNAAGAYTIGSFGPGQDGQSVSILPLDSHATVIHNSASVGLNPVIYTNTAANVALAAHKVYRFTYFASQKKWIMDA